jgi:hypothetical protein
MSKSKPKSKAIPKKKEIERTLVTFFNQKKRNEPHEKDQTIHLPCNVKIRSKSKAVSKKKEREGT